MAVKILALDGDGLRLEKRTYLPFVLVDNCPKCGREVSMSLLEQYVFYPCVGENSITMVCATEEEDCRKWQVNVRLGFTLVVV